MSPAYRLRPATAEDYAFLEQLHRRTLRPYVERTWGWDDAEQAAMFRRRFDPALLVIVVVDERDAGVLHVERRADETFLVNIALDPEFQGRGIGTAIVGDVLAEGAPVTLQVLRVNPARGLYERLGFRLTEETATHYRMRAGPAVT